MSINVDRLHELVNHLRDKDSFPEKCDEDEEDSVHKKFLFSVYAKGEIDKEGNYYGILHGPEGEFPVIWPEEWGWRRDKGLENFYGVVHQSQSMNDTKTNHNTIAEFFSITIEQMRHLFIHGFQKLHKKEFGGKELNANATAEQVAANIDAFIKKVAA